MEQLPLFLDLRHKSCLVVGGGRIAERKVRLLLRAGASVRLVAPVICQELALLKEARLTRHYVRFERHMCEGQWLVICATNQTHVNRKVAEAASAVGVWCNVVDDVELSTAFFPAIIDRSPVGIAIGTAGTSPTLARRIKRQLELALPERLGELAVQAGRWRDIVKRRIKKPRDRRLFWEKIFSGPVARHLLAGRRTDANREFNRLLSAPTAKRRVGEAYLVGAGPGDASLLTLRGHQLLSQADVVLYDALISDAILDFARKEATRICVGKRPGESHKQAEITRTLVRLVAKGHRVCRLKGGDPMVFGRGGEEAEALAEAGLPFEIVPGITAAVGCAASAGIPLTHRGVSASLTLATAAREGSTEPDWSNLARPGQTLVLYMSVGSLEKATGKLMAEGLPPTTSCALVENGTCANERVLQGELLRIAHLAREQGVKPPALLFVGDAVAKRVDAEKITLWNNKDYLLYHKVLST